MPQKYLLFGLVVICFTILLLTWMVRDLLCELQRRQGNIELVAFLACDIKQ
ncbi:type I toxin-antitoxin system toxin HokA [Klebsiella pneumoniae]|nr:type I toxin-antitoxin system toxin HokA [Klebsiella pneumoniae]HBT2360246.1 type I toxin-antitoxin system toxin HokA [Klebsiella pneumoniae subsp. pneumoniae]HBV0708085.1 type I toxin-antitoxin system toxin HokA [Klebsiella pneumoniae]HDS2488515.1 type I toxin-antitoxin system toxin HokA [Klebsiella pneumoniae subsp. pneumoniae]HDS5167847.1 type I toxin-antitoxin system toxin HokA [Klebsiella pneumoniae]